MISSTILFMQHSVNILLQHTGLKESKTLFIIALKLSLNVSPWNTCLLINELNLIPFINDVPSPGLQNWPLPQKRTAHHDPVQCRVCIKGKKTLHLNSSWTQIC